MLQWKDSPCISTGSLNTKWRFSIHRMSSKFSKISWVSNKSKGPVKTPFLKYHQIYAAGWTIIDISFIAEREPQLRSSSTLASAKVVNYQILLWLNWYWIETYQGWLGHFIVTFYTARRIIFYGSPCGHNLWAHNDDCCNSSANVLHTTVTYYFEFSRVASIIYM